MFSVLTWVFRVRRFKGESVPETKVWLASIQLACDNANDGEVHADVPPVTVLTVSIKSVDDVDRLVARTLSFGSALVVAVAADESVCVATSDGGLAELSPAQLQRSGEMEISVQGVDIAQCLLISLSAVSSHDSQVSIFNWWRGFAHLDNHMSIVVMLVSILVVVLSWKAGTMSALGVLALIVSVFGICSSCFILITTIIRPSTSTTAYKLEIMGHKYLAEDDCRQSENDIPQRFINGCDGDLSEARRRWDITRKWREDTAVNEILNQPQPMFNVIRNYYPHYHAGKGKLGHLVYYERPGEFDFEKLHDYGVNMEDMFRHCLFLVEYQWQVMSPDEMSQLIVVYDLERISLATVSGERGKLSKRVTTAANHHYPERAHVIYIVNVPGWFSILWRMIKPLVHENTLKKIRILTKSETLAGLSEHIEIEDIPDYYGGQLGFGGHDSCRLKSPQTAAIEDFVRELNARHNVETMAL
jgi:hypothetical protein